MSDIVERLRAFPSGDGEGGLFHDAADEIERLEALKTPATRSLLSITQAALDSAEAEIERLEADKAAISETASGYLHEIERLRAGKAEGAMSLLCDLVDRWPDERGYDGAIQRARSFVLEYHLRWPTKEQIKAAIHRD